MADRHGLNLCRGQAEFWSPATRTAAGRRTWLYPHIAETQHPRTRYAAALIRAMSPGKAGWNGVSGSPENQPYLRRQSPSSPRFRML